MKYYIVSTFEMDGHSSGFTMICSSLAAKSQYLKDILTDLDGKLYPTDSVHEEEDGSTTMYGHWDCGEWSINILPFKTYKSIENKERACQTG